MALLEYGSTPDVGSSKMTTFDPPTNAMATDSFLCIPPVGWRAIQEKRRAELGSALLVIERLTGEVLSLVVPLVRQREVGQHVLHLPLGLRLRATFQQRVEQDVLLHREAATASIRTCVPGLSVRVGADASPELWVTALSAIKDLDVMAASVKV